MKLRDVMTRDIEICRPDSSLREAAERMRQRNVGCIPVCEDNRILGILTDRDIVVRGIAEGRDPNSTKVRELMTREVVYAFEDQDIQEGARLMEQRKVRRLPILNHQSQPVGIISVDDLAVQASEMEKLAGQVLAGVVAVAPGH